MSKPVDGGGFASDVLAEVERAVVGKSAQLRLVLTGIVAGGHILFEDLPGLGKTLTARSFARVLGLEFGRIQFTPDLLPSDVTGSSVFDQRDSEFHFRAGPLFANLLLADEINRTPPRTQAALLEAMQERQVTVDGETYQLDPPFHVLATANPIEHEGTYPLPEAQLDRFLLRVSFGYLGNDDERDLIGRRVARSQEEVDLTAVSDRASLLAVQAAVEEVVVEESVGHYLVDIVRATRGHPRVLVGASTRGALALLQVARASAVLAGRNFVTPDDVKSLAVPCLGHRLVLRPESYLERIDAADIVRDVLADASVPVSAAVPRIEEVAD